MENKFFVIDSDASTWEEAIKQCALELQAHDLVEPSFMDACIAREKEFPTGLETELGVAIPHTGAEHVKENAICILRLKKPVKFCRMDDPDLETDVFVVFNLAICDAQQQLSTLRAIVRLVQDGTYMKACMDMTLPEFKAATFGRIYGESPA